MLCDGNIISCVVAGSLCDATVTLSDLLGLKYTACARSTLLSRADYDYRLTTAESLLHPQVVLGHAQSMSATVCFLISYLEMHPINDVHILDSKATHSLCDFILNNTGVQLYTVYVLKKYSSTSLIGMYRSMCLKKNQNAPRPSEHPPVRGKKCQNV